MTTAFFQGNPSWVQTSVYWAQAASVVTDTAQIQLPVNCVLAGQQRYREKGRDYELYPQNLKTKGVNVTRSLRRLSREKPSFTVTTSKTGRD